MNKKLAQYTCTKEGYDNFYDVEIHAVGKVCHVWGDVRVPSTVAEAVKFMYVVSAKKLVVDEYTIGLVQ